MYTNMEDAPTPHASVPLVPVVDEMQEFPLVLNRLCDTAPEPEFKLIDEIHEGAPGLLSINRMFAPAQGEEPATAAVPEERIKFVTVMPFTLLPKRLKVYDPTTSDKTIVAAMSIIVAMIGVTALLPFLLHILKRFILYSRFAKVISKITFRI
jgi:hypothetical protein